MNIQEDSSVVYSLDFRGYVGHYNINYILLFNLLQFGDSFYTCSFICSYNSTSSSVVMCSSIVIGVIAVYLYATYIRLPTSIILQLKVASIFMRYKYCYND